MAIGDLQSQGLDALKERVGAQIQRERGDWNSVSRRLMDTFGWSGKFLDESARDFFFEIERASADGELTAGELTSVLNRYTQFAELVKEYQAEKDDVGEIAGDVAAAAAAVMVTALSGGSAMPLVVGIAAARTTSSARPSSGRTWRSAASTARSLSTPRAWRRPAPAAPRIGLSCDDVLTSSDRHRSRAGR